MKIAYPFSQYLHRLGVRPNEFTQRFISIAKASESENSIEGWSYQVEIRTSSVFPTLKLNVLWQTIIVIKHKKETIIN